MSEYNVQVMLISGMIDGVTLNGERCEYLTTASRKVYLSPDKSVVIKIGKGWTAGQCWDEFHAYHEVLDDDARAMVPAVRDVGMLLVDGVICGYTVMDYEPMLVTGDYAVVPDYLLAKHNVRTIDAMKAWRRHVQRMLQNKYLMNDLHTGNLAWTTDGRLVLVDLGMGFHKGASRARSTWRSERMRRAVERLPVEATVVLNLV